MIEVEILTEKSDPDTVDWEALGVSQSDLDPAKDLTFRTIYLDPEKIEWFEGVYHAPEWDANVINIRTVSGKMVTAKMNKSLDTYFRWKFKNHKPYDPNEG